MPGPFDRDDTPLPVITRPGASAAELDLELAQNEVARLRLQLAALTADADALRTENGRLKLLLRQMARRPA